ncbi:U-box domain-containing protein 11 [Abrus precatorius]|uniref:U-box domain-containing protein 11 n=1 Tax=Abrus precatorius TaxID=3816 RepID=A0A8B8LMF8_ABRPR|nr:U-box domain-containing protein 11 [Abrus precatorius]
MESKRRSVRSLVSKLSSVSEPARIDALCQLRLMSKQDPETRPVIAELGAIPYLAETLYSSSHPSQENAAATLLNLSITEKEPLMSTRGVLDAIAHVISHHNSTSSAAAVQSSAAVIHSILSSVDQYRPVVGAKREIVYALIDILRCHASSPPRTIKDALKALFAVALHPLNRGTMVHLGVVPALFSLVVKDGRIGIVEDATAVIAQVAGCEDSADAFVKVSGVGVLADLLDLATGSSMRTKENAVSALLNLVRCGGEKVAGDVRDVVAFGALDGIADVRDGGSGKGKSKATELLKLLLGDSNENGNGNVSLVLSSDNGSSFGSLRNHDSD